MQPQPQPSAPPPMMLNITTEQIQKYLDDNKQLIMAILEYQNQGKFAECTPRKWQRSSAVNSLFLPWLMRCFRASSGENRDTVFLLSSTFDGCSRYQAQLQQNLMFLARIADIQPQGTTAPSQMLPQASAQQEHYVQPSQAAMPQQQMHFTPKLLPLQLDDQQQQQLPSLLQQQQFIQGQLRMRPGVNDGDAQP